ncbi:hypothetical protein SMD44_08367 [Streptomyces alboflavus]|uniref:Uncharacterized protein n=1 Tax=Streptomyces alboflavus TaxID=67267 RepID=A0A1Z1WR44_9ACTN|nr:hypothetical protein [Streptomyces alboflavus]ARX88880.1 hypothetical protein SMD44_08367 [Streptomyces alboflavus]
MPEGELEAALVRVLEQRAGLGRVAVLPGPVQVEGAGAADAGGGSRL